MLVILRESVSSCRTMIGRTEEGIVDIYSELGITPVINAAGAITRMGGNTPSRVVRDTMKDIEKHYFGMADLLDKTGAKLAEMLGVESVLITSGCTSALMLSAAACITGNSVANIKRIPNTEGLPNQFIALEPLHYTYERSVELVGGELVFVGDPMEASITSVVDAICDRTAGIYYVAHEDSAPSPSNLQNACIKVPELGKIIEVAKSHGLPVIVDAASHVYPIENLSKFAKMGADLVGYGGKYFGGFNSSGLLMGRKDLIDISKKHNFVAQEFEDTELFMPFGRAMKLDRQEVVGTYVAVREWITMNHEARFAEYAARVDGFRRLMLGVNGVNISDFPDKGPVNGVRVKIDDSKTRKSLSAIKDELVNGNPIVWVGKSEWNDSLLLKFDLLNEGEEKMIAARLKEIIL